MKTNSSDFNFGSISPEQAVHLQDLLRVRVIEQPLPFQDLKFVAGADASYQNIRARAAVVVMSWPVLQVVDWAIAEIAAPYPYMPGLLAFRELPAILKAVEQLNIQPDVFICDGQGLAHPQRFGLACHLGVLLDRPTLGCAKSILVGQHGPLGASPGSRADLVDGYEVVGAVVRTRQGVKPVYISVGHRIDLSSAIQLVLTCCRGYRLPEPIRQADHLARHSTWV